MRTCVDRGGTFTDVVVVDDDGRARARKVRSDVAIVGQLAEGALTFGTTVATNALLERRGVPTLLVVTRGFADLVRIGDMTRPELFDPDARWPEPLCVRVAEVGGRIDADGREIEPLGEVDVDVAGVEAVAVVLLNSHLDPSHERRVGTALPPGVHVVLGHQASPEAGYLARIETALVDASITPVLREALVRDGIRDDDLAMRSDGSLVRAAELRAPDAVLSGPAGGVLAVAAVARQAGFARAVGLDMGGTSTDVCRVEGGVLPRREGDVRVAGARLRRPMLEVETIAAGGGSILWDDGLRIGVGPRSAGADPGPQCWGRGGPPTLTDAALLAGLIDPDAFDPPLDPAAVRLPGEASAFLEVARESMAAAVRRIATARGVDLADHALVAYGGAAGQHAAHVAERLGIRVVLVHPLASVLCAWGQALARREAHGVRALWVPFPEGWDEVVAAWTALAAELPALGETVRTVELRHPDTDHAWEVGGEGPEEVVAAWVAEHRRRFGFDRPGALFAVNARVRVRAPEPPLPAVDDDPWRIAEVFGDQGGRDAHPTVEGGARDDHPTVEGGERDDHPTGDGGGRGGHRAVEGARGGEGADPRDPWGGRPARPGPSGAGVVRGPLLLTSPTTSVHVPAGWTARLHRGLLWLEHEAATPRPPPTKRTPLGVALWGARFMAVAEQAGAALQRLARSVNIRERLDFSCAVFDEAGHLVANAPHIPVHLGAMGETVRDLLRTVDPEPGQAYLTNDPAAGGSHLPDLTVVTPVRIGPRRFFVASRGHHVDVGGTTPGSMPPRSVRIEDEGFVVRHLPLLREGGLRDVRDRLVGCRQPATVVADLEAQVAANALAGRLLAELGDAALIARWMAILQDVADEAVARVVEDLAPGGAEDTLGGVPLKVRLVPGDGLVVDWTGTGGPHPGNLNAPRAVVRAAVLYALRVLVAEPIPLNEGALRRVRIVVPSPSLLDPPAGAAIAGGNVETSQRLVDLVLRAAGDRAASVGTMSNLTVGGAGWSLYETIGGGEGASRRGPGASGRQVHMTNTRATDPEVLEARLPLRVRGFSLRRGSGGDGVHRGGDGLVREIEVTAPATAALLASRRDVGAPGLDGGGTGAPGRDAVCRAGVWSAWDGDAIALEPGDRVRIETPGGGGWGTPESA